MKIVLFFVLAGLAGVSSLAMWLNYRQNSQSLYPRTDFAVMPSDLTPVVKDKMSFVYKDPQKGYTVNVDNVAFDPASQQAVLGGTVIESSDPTLPTGSRTIIFVQGTQDFWQNFPSVPTLGYF